MQVFSIIQLMFAHNENDTLIASSLDGSISVFNLGDTPPSVSHSLTTNSQVPLTTGSARKTPPSKTNQENEEKNLYKWIFGFS